MDGESGPPRKLGREKAAAERRVAGRPRRSDPFLNGTSLGVGQRSGPHPGFN
ncbi:hypothetical protein HMPREF0972_00412 [Actinomyces sp. oral taxon 848 str. F0332]|nr:hypothetical protein HMPREF0972_00412 [Actinomyces sp. oral taxon 848 str. F0332]